jgi:hypothetical protein
MAAIVAPHCRTVSLPGMERATRGECGDSSELDESFVPKPHPDTTVSGTPRAASPPPTERPRPLRRDP